MTKFLRRMNKSRVEAGFQIQSGVAELLKATQNPPSGFTKFFFNSQTSPEFDKAQQSLNKLTHWEP